MSSRCLACCLHICAGLWGSVPGLASAQEAAAAAEQQASPFSLSVSGGFGIGLREVEVPMDGAIYQTRTGTFPAFGVGFALDYAASDAVSAGLLVRYQSSMPGHSIAERHVDGAERRMDVRSHRLELGLAPIVHLDARKRWALSASVGYAERNLRPEVGHLVTPSYSLAGPHLRLEVRVPLWQEALRLRVGPEVHWLLHVGSALRDREVEDGGFGIGGEAVIELDVAARFAVQLAYRQMQVSLGASQADSFRDRSRFMTARLVGKL